MSKGARNRKRRAQRSYETENIDWGGVTFVLPDTPENRECAEELTGVPADQLLDEHGMLTNLDIEMHPQAGR
jgi:hypothetical protein